MEKAALGGGGPAFLITAKAKSNAFLDALCPVSDTMTALVDARGFYIVRSEKNLREGRYKAHERVDFDYALKEARVESLTNGSVKTIPLEGPTQDPLSAFYWFRMQDVREGEVVRVPVTADEKNWELEVHVGKAETLEIRKKGVFEAFMIQPKAKFKGVFVKRGKAWVHLTADARRIPVKIKMNTHFGPVFGVLEEPPA